MGLGEVEWHAFPDRLPHVHIEHIHKTPAPTMASKQRWFWLGWGSAMLGFFIANTILGWL